MGSRISASRAGLLRRRLSNRTLLLVILVLPTIGFVTAPLLILKYSTHRVPVETATLEFAARYLAQRQQPDGAWRGEEVAVLRPGPAMTGLVLVALARMPPDIRDRHAASIERGLRCLKAQVDAEGRVGLLPDAADYPNYATALAILALARLDAGGARPLIERMAGSLASAQLDEEEGWNPSDPEYGGWAFGGKPRPKPDAFRLDLSVTRFVLEALAQAGVAKENPLWARARVFVERCQNYDRDPRDDGGFFFTPLPSQNKAGVVETGPNAEFRLSYGTATADGLICLRLTGASSERIEAATRWLDERFATNCCPGFEPRHQPPWHEGLRGYWLAAVARAMASERPAWRDRIVHALASTQRTDGLWVNASPLMRENDPLLATALAVLAVDECAGFR
ncbi:MAG: terpene cyclase/mutase family protein [Planctomycetes bacterium]|nr:terpene cyclase/mutase family protein [Planctomycetota bacterium]